MGEIDYSGLFTQPAAGSGRHFGSMLDAVIARRDRQKELDQKAAAELQEKQMLDARERYRIDMQDREARATNERLTTEGKGKLELDRSKQDQSGREAEAKAIEQATKMANEGNAAAGDSYLESSGVRRPLEPSLIGDLNDVGTEMGNVRPEAAPATRETSAYDTIGENTPEARARRIRERFAGLKGISPGMVNLIAGSAETGLVKPGEEYSQIVNTDAQRRNAITLKSMDIGADKERDAAKAARDAANPRDGQNKPTSTDIKAKSDVDQELQDTEGLAALIEANPKAWQEYRDAKARIANDENYRESLPYIGKVGVGISRAIGSATGGRVGSPNPDKLGEQFSPEAHQINTAIQRKITAKAKALGGAVTESDIVQIEKGMGVYGNDAKQMAEALRKDAAAARKRKQDLLNNVRFADEKAAPAKSLVNEILGEP